LSSETTDRRRALTLVSLATGLSLLGDSAMYTVLPTHTASAGITIASVGIILSANRFIRLLFNGPIGLLSDRLSRRAIFVPATFLGVLSTFLYALTPGLGVLFIGRLFWGIAWAGIWVSGNAIVLDITGDEDRGRGVGIYQISFFLGAASGAILGGILTDWLGYRPAMFLSAGSALVGALAALFFLPETGRGTKRSPTFDTDDETVEKRGEWPQLLSSIGIYSINRLVVAGIFVATFGLFLAQNLDDNVRIGETSFGISTLTGLGLGATTLFGMIAAPVAGNISDKIGSRWSVISFSLISGIAGFLIVSIGVPVLILLGLPLIAIASGSNSSLSTALVGDLSPARKRGQRLGVFFTAGDLGSAMGPLIAYSLMPLIGLSAIYRLGAAFYGISLIGAFVWGIIVIPSRSAVTQR